ncbi:hypothetical protein LTR97_009623 [Elasticomyces elasticus]|uniref:DUF7730 domain-containing protein n=1 Tax=Elasticomyces elasticus TaxID=574655 RepID=A0AAN7ZZG3_9PEZI|nr:hypothetical protein LTR97_009623 [Elasticomyces elasticus]
MPAMNLTTDPSTHAYVSDSPLLSLPPEMRNRIYEYVMTVGTVYVQLEREAVDINVFVIDEDSAVLSQHDRRLKVVKSPFARNQDSAQQPAGRYCLPLLRTCKQVNREAAKMFIVCNSFELQAFDTDSSLANNGLIYPGVFLGDHKATDIVAAMPRFIATIGTSDAKLLADVTLHLGQFDDCDAIDGAPRALVTIKQILDQLRSFQAFNPSCHLKMAAALRMDIGEIIEFQEMVLDVKAPTPGVKVAAEGIQDRVRSLQPNYYSVEQLTLYGNFLCKLQEAAEIWDEYGGGYESCGQKVYLPNLATPILQGRLCDDRVIEQNVRGSTMTYGAAC